MRWNPSLWASSFVVMVLTGCPGQQPNPEEPKAAAPPARVESKEEIAWRMSTSGPGFRLSNADPARPPERVVAQTKALSLKRTHTLVKALPKFTAPATKKPFAMRAKTMPAPRPGETLATPFPPANERPRPDVTPNAAEKLSVLRFAPEGDVTLAPNLSITFSQPMVAVTSLEDLSKAKPPVSLVPEPPGKWRWIGTQTVLFEPEERFPMATDYRVTVPGGTAAVSGASLEQATEFSFKTPPLSLKAHLPSGWSTVDLDQKVFLEFDQRIDPQKLIPFVELKGPNGAVELRSATPGEIGEDDELRRAVDRSEKDRILALVPARPLEKHTNYSLRIRADAPSAEGPKVTQSEQGFGFNTYGPMTLRNIRCGWGEDCPPLTPWYLEFSNPIDRKTFNVEQVKVSPAIEGFRASVSGSMLLVQGRTKGRTTYTVSIEGPLADKYGQTLVQPAVVTQKVSSAEPVLFPEQEPMAVLDPAFEPALRVYSVNRKALSVRLYQVKPEDYARYFEWRQDWDYNQKLTQPPGKLMFKGVVTPKGGQDELIETRVDLARALQGGVGQVLVVVEPTTQPKKDRWGGVRREWVRTWLQVTKLGLHAYADSEALVGWASELATGKPVAGVEIGLLGRKDTELTAADGLGRLALGDTGGMVFARHGQDLVMAPASQHYFNSESYVRHSPADGLRWFVFDDRHLYKPGETVNAKGWIRVSGNGKGGDIVALPQAERHHVEYVVRDSRGNEVKKGTTSVDTAGSFHLSFPLPGTMNLGNASLELYLRGPSGFSNDATGHSFSVEEFRRPEYEVRAVVSEGPHVLGRRAIATVTADYFAGGGLPGADVAWNVNASEVYFQPPKHPTFHFGKAHRWFWDSGKPAVSESFESKTDTSGAHQLRIDFEGVEPAFTRRFELTAEVTDVNRQSWAARTDFLLHPADLFVGLRIERPYVEVGQHVNVGTLVSDLDGKVVAGHPVTVEFSRIESDYDGEEWVEKKVGTKTCTLTSAADAGQCQFDAAEAGNHRFSANVTDEYGRKSTTELDLWVLGQTTDNQRLQAGTVQLVPDRTEYQGGDMAKLLVMAPFAPAEGVLTLRRQGMVEVRRFTLTESSTVLDVPIDAKFTPNLHAQVDLVGAAVRDNEKGDPDVGLPKRPAFASGHVTLKVPPKDRTLEIAIAPSQRFLKPGAAAKLGIRVTDSKGEPVRGGRLAVVVVDESVLALSGYELPDPLEVFYAERSADVSDLETRLNVTLGRPNLEQFRLESQGAALPRRNGGGKMRMKKSAEAYEMQDAPAMAPAPMQAAPMGELALAEAANEASPDGKPAPSFQLRSDFRALAAFVPDVTTDDDGRAEVRFKLPDSLTRYRVMVVASSGQQSFGHDEDAITARLPLMVRASPPRFLNFGDRFELPVVVQNQTNQEQTVEVVARFANLEFQGSPGLTVQVPANDRVEVRFPAAAGSPGTARLQVGASSSAGSDASEHELPIWTPATTEAFATYGQVDQGAVAQKVKIPSDAVKEFGELSITTSSTALQGLTDAVLYLVRYPFECNEQLASRVLAIAALRDVLTAFQVEGMPKEKELHDFVKKDIERLAGRQHWSGGWDFWRKDRNPDPYVSAHVAHALVRAKEKGYPVPNEVLRQAFSYLDNIHGHIPSRYSKDSRWVIEAYALYVRHRGAQPDATELRRIFDDAKTVEALPLEALGFMLPSTQDAAFQKQRDQIRRHIANRVAETAGMAHFATSYSDGAHVLMHSSRRADGILLEGLIGDQPTSDLIPKLVKGLLAHRKRGRWHNTQENAFVLLALDRYFNTFEKATPNFVARAWLGQDYALEHAFKGRSVDYQEVQVPLAFLDKYGAGTDLVLQKEGEGRLYYRVGMNYAPKSLWLAPFDAGFAVDRQYEAVDDPSDVSRDSKGVWRIRAGATVRVRLHMVARATRYHVALVDALPAGFESMNPALAMTGDLPEDPNEPTTGLPWWWSRPWFEHQNLRDERAEAFTSYLGAGVYDYSYVARATTPGTFVVPPAKAEEMYAPETFGRSGSDRVVVF
jgi:alpha-2-macroglobulin